MWTANNCFKLVKYSVICSKIQSCIIIFLTIKRVLNGFQTYWYNLTWRSTTWNSETWVFILFYSFFNSWIYIYIYIYYCHPETGCITAIQCGVTREMLQAESETRLTLRQSDILPQTHLSVNEWIFTYIFFTYTLLAPGVLNSWKEHCISAYVATGISPTRVLTPQCVCVCVCECYSKILAILAMAEIASLLFFYNGVFGIK